VDVTKTYLRDEQPHVGTINTWVFINGKLTDEAFIQAMITATEAKTKALADQQVTDAFTGTIATSTATDSLLIAATQHGPQMQYAGPITDIGKLIGRGVFETTIAAIKKYKEM
jgi:iron complex transport system ATP-binding protein